MLHPPGGKLQPLHVHCIQLTGLCRRHCNHCSNTASTFLGTASSITTYCMHLLRNCIQCLGTASTFSDNAVGTATTAGTLHTAEVALQVHCIQHRLTASTFVGTATSITTYNIHVMGHSNYCMGTASKLRELYGPLQPWQHHCIHLHGPCILHDNTLHPPCGTLHSLHDYCIHIPRICGKHCKHCKDTDFSCSGNEGVQQSLQAHCIHLRGHCIFHHNI